MQKLIKIFLIFIIILTPLKSLAEEPRIKLPSNLKLIDIFEEFPTTVEVNGEFFMGILVSENTYDQIITDKIELNSLRRQISIYEQFDIKLEENFQKYNNITIDNINQMKDIINKPVTKSFWEVNKTWIIFSIGVLTGVAIYKVSTL